MVQKHRLQIREYLPKNIFSVAGHNYNYMNYANANYLRNHFVDHGSVCVCSVSCTQGKTPWVDSACAQCPGFLVLLRLSASSRNHRSLSFASWSLVRREFLGCRIRSAGIGLFWGENFVAQSLQVHLFSPVRCLACVLNLQVVAREIVWQSKP